MLARMGRITGGVAAAALVLVGLAAAKESYRVSATLNVKQEVPKQAMSAPNARGLFTGTVVENGRKATLKWKLSYSHLSGAATAAHIHLGKRGVAGNVLVALCGRNCRSGMTGTATFSKDVVDNIERGRTYVNVHTAKNPAGEIRGQVRVSG
jgi:phosphoribosylformylglycinamidine (FGAM) synthase-like enzyme